jgi:hypothetical protein
VIRQNEFKEMMEIPNRFKKDNLPPKIRVIPEIEQPKIKGIISTQFWVKSSFGFSDSHPICRVVFNKNDNMFFSLNSAGITVLEKIEKKIIFTQKWNLPNKFYEWTRILIQVRLDYDDGELMKLSIMNSVNGISGELIEHEDNNNLKITSLDFIFGSDSFLTNQLQQ